MKIIHVITGLNNGGAEAVLYRLCKYDSKNQHIVISMMDNGKYGILLLNQNISVYTLNMPVGKLTITGIVNLFKIINKEKPDVVQTWMYHANLVGGIISKFLRIKKIIWCIHHSNLDETHNKKSTILIAKILGKISAFIPTDIVFCAKKSYDIHKKIGYKCKNMNVIVNGYELDKFYPNEQNIEKLKNEFNLIRTENIIGFVARFDELKDHDNLLNSLSLIKNHNVSFKCLLVGSNMINTNNKLVKMIKKYDLFENILLLGERDDIPNIMNLLDIHILSSYSEAFPNVLCEAMACGTPCITTDVGDANFIVSNTGLIVPIKNSLELSNAIEILLTEKNQDKNKFIERKIKSRERVINEFNIDRMIKSYNKIWSKNEKKTFIHN